MKCAVMWGYLGHLKCSACPWSSSYVWASDWRSCHLFLKATNPSPPPANETSSLFCWPCPHPRVTSFIWPGVSRGRRHEPSSANSHLHNPVHSHPSPQPQSGLDSQVFKIPSEVLTLSDLWWSSKFDPIFDKEAELCRTHGTSCEVQEEDKGAETLNTHNYTPLHMLQKVLLCWLNQFAVIELGEKLKILLFWAIVEVIDEVTPTKKSRSSHQVWHFFCFCLVTQYWFSVLTERFAVGDGFWFLNAASLL